MISQIMEVFFRLVYSLVVLDSFRKWALAFMLLRMVYKCATEQIDQMKRKDFMEQHYWILGIMALSVNWTLNDISLFWLYCSFLLVGYGIWELRFRRDGKRKIKTGNKTFFDFGLPTRGDIMRMFPESAIMGSQIMKDDARNMPKCTKAVYLMNDYGEFEPVGSCYRMGNTLVLAKHLVCNESSFYLKNRDGVSGMTRVNLYEAATPQFMTFLEDVAVVNANFNWADLGMSEAKIGSFSNGNVVTCYANSESEHSVGQVYVEKTNPSLLLYYGSTRPGFSGGVYMRGTEIVGLHLGGSGRDVNYGAPAALIKMLFEDRVRSYYAPESAKRESNFEESLYLINQLRKNAGTQWYGGETEDVLYAYDGSKYYRFNRDFLVKVDESEGDDAMQQYAAQAHKAKVAALKKYQRDEESDDEYSDASEDFKPRKRVVKFDDTDEDTESAEDDQEYDYFPEGKNSEDFVKHFAKLRIPETKLLDAMDIQDPVYRNFTPLVAPVVTATPLVREPQVNLNSYPGVPRTVELPRVVDELAEERTMKRSMYLNKEFELKTKRLMKAAEVQDLTMEMVATRNNPTLHSSLVEKFRKTQEELTLLNAELKAVSMLAEEYKKLTPEEAQAAKPAKNKKTANKRKARKAKAKAAAAPESSESPIPVIPEKRLPTSGRPQRASTSAGNGQSGTPTIPNVTTDNAKRGNARSRKGN